MHLISPISQSSKLILWTTSYIKIFSTTSGMTTFLYDQSLCLSTLSILSLWRLWLQNETYPLSSILSTVSGMMTFMGDQDVPSQLKYLQHQQINVFTFSNHPIHFIKIMDYL